MPLEHINIRPVIRELVRTQVCFSDIRLLVDRVTIVDLPVSSDTENRQAYRLYLTDGEKAIQVVVRRPLHRTIANGEIREGSFVVLRDYRLARARKMASGGEVMYLQVADFYSVGEDGRQYEESPIKTSSASDGDDAHSSRRGVPTPSLKPLPSKRKLDTALSEPDANPRKRGRELGRSVTDPEQEAGSDPTSVSDAFNGGELDQKRSEFDPLKDESNSKEELTYIAAQELYIASNRPPSFEKATTNNPKPITRPLKISTLASLTGANRSKNEIHDVLALIVHVDAHTYKPPRMPRKRDLRIMDTSTSKRVVLSVFTDPVGFEPKVGTMAIFRNLTTHDWDGGNLKAYPWLCEDRDWFVPVPDDGTPEGIERETVGRLRELRDGMEGAYGSSVGLAQRESIT